MPKYPESIESSNVMKPDKESAQVVPKTTISTISREIGQPGIVTGAKFIQASKKRDLADFYTMLNTFDTMCNDSAVHTSISFTNLLVANALFKGEFKPNPKSKNSKSEKLAEFLNYNIRMMPYGTWWDVIQNMTTDLKYGFSLSNLVLYKAKSGPYKNSKLLKKISPRDQKSIYGWVWDNKFREFQGFVQKKNLRQNKGGMSRFLGGLNQVDATRYYELGYPYLKKEQLVHCTYNSTNNNPQGDPPLLHCYDAWAEKRLIEDYELAGVSKDLGGMVVLRVPSKLIEQANDPERYPDAYSEYTALQQNAADLHAAKSSYLVLTSDSYQDTKQYMYNVELLGISGSGGKQYNTSDIIREKQKHIYNCFGAGFLILGQESTGSYALSTTGQSTHGSYVEYNSNYKVNVIENQIGKRIIDANNEGNSLSIKWSDYPVYEAHDPVQPDWDVVSRFIQRLKATGALTKEATKAIYYKLGLPLDGIDDLIFDDADTSRSGDGMVSPGEGTSTNIDGQDHSDANLENAGTQKSLRNFIEDSRWGLIDVETDTPLR